MKRRIFFIFVIIVIAFYGCRTTEEVPIPPTEKVLPEPEPLPVKEPDPLNINWAGTAWIIPDSPEKSSKEFPGYRGFYLGRDGRLLLINLDSSAGDTWSVAGNRISLSLLEGTAGIPLDGTFLIFPVNAQSIRLVPESSPATEGITLERVKVKVDIVENHWIPRTLKGGETVMWPMNREIHLMLLPDAGGMGVLGYGGENRFHGGVQLGDESFVVGPLAMTRRIGPASEFETLYVQRISETNRFVQAGDDLFLYSDTYPVAAFRVRLFD